MRFRALALLLAATAAACDPSSSGAPSSDGDAGPDASDTAGDAAVDGATPDVALPLAEPPVYGRYDAHPEPPTILRDVSMIDDDVRFAHPYVPGHRTTMDGRLALRVQGGPPGTTRLRQNLSFFLLVPEAVEEPIMPGPAGATILTETEPFDVVFPPALLPETSRLGHHAICDATEEFAVAGERPNPYPCGTDDAHDCYAITVVSSTSPGIGAQLWGTPAVIEVEAPKTAEARIVSVELGEPVAGTFIELTGEWTEPAVTVDGRLLTGRWGRAPRQWTNPETGVTITRNWDLAYSLLPDDADPCDVRGWTDFHPISHAPYDPRMVGRYGLAAYPFRDTEGNPIADGEDVGGTYPWVDREGANVFMTGVQGRMVEQSEEDYPRRCVVEGCEDLVENNDWDRGFLVAGLWTHGKFVHLDAMINNMDWAVGVTPAAHFLVDLYRDADGQPVPVRFGSGRFIDRKRDEGGPYPPEYTHNANILDSLQNLPNHHAPAHPVTPRDVVWLMSSGVATDEVAFDDFLDIDAFVVSTMQGSITPVVGETGATVGLPHYWNGQVRELTLPLAVAELNALKPDLDDEIHVQNAATSLRWNVPAYGLVDAGAGRIEPVALGGITGKGFWLSGDTAIRYTVPAQPRSIDDTDWYVAIFLDPRADEERVALAFPDGTALHTIGHSAVRYVSGDRIVHEVALPDGDGWFHLGLRLEDGNRDVTLLHDGLALDRFRSERPLFRMVEGELVVGQPADDSGFRGFRGWVDELLVLAHVPNLEVACNHAHGTLVRIDANESWGAAAARHPAWAHAEIAAAAGAPEGSVFACYHDYSRDYAAHLSNLPAGTASVREAINFPEGPLRAGAPRPDSSANAFCLTCHHDQGRGGLGTAALEYRAGTPAEDDPRRQPLQPPRRVFGNVPPGWIAPGRGVGSPAEGTRAPAEGLLVDRWLLPSAE